MNSPDDIKNLVRVLRECGVTHYKTSEIELSLEPQPPVEVINKDKADPLAEIRSIFNMSDTQLVEKLFPVDSERSPEEVLQ